MAKTPQQFSVEFEEFYSLWLAMEGGVGVEPDGTYVAYGINARYNPEILNIARISEKAPTEQLRTATLKWEAKQILYKKYYLPLKSKGTVTAPYEFFFKRAWSTPYTRKLSIPQISWQLITDPIWLSMNCASKYISENAVLRRVRLFNEKYRGIIL